MLFMQHFLSGICVLCKRVKAWWSGLEKPTRNPGPRFLSSHPALWEWQINGFRSSWASAQAGRAFSRQEWGHRLIRKPSLQSNRGRRPWSGTKIQQSTFLQKATWDLQLCCEFLLSIRGRRTKAIKNAANVNFHLQLQVISYLRKCNGDAPGTVVIFRTLWYQVLCSLKC